MDFSNLARTRASVRKYDPYRVPDEATIADILETAAMAPSAVNRQPWKFHVLRSHAALEGVRAAYTRDWFLDAPCVLAVSGSRQAAWTRAYDGFNSLQTDLAIVATYLILAARDKGLGTCWISNFEPQVLRSALGLTDDEDCYFISPLGYPAAADSSNKGEAVPANATLPRRDRKPLNDLVIWR